MWANSAVPVRRRASSTACSSSSLHWRITFCRENARARPAQRRLTLPAAAETAAGCQAGGRRLSSAARGSPCRREPPRRQAAEANVRWYSAAWIFRSRSPHQNGDFLLGIAREISSTMIFSDNRQKDSPEPDPVLSCCEPRACQRNKRETNINKNHSLLRV